jgi:membrane-associated protease RseP (regulator of RpoE activity)
MAKSFESKLENFQIILGPKEIKLEESKELLI